MKNKNLFRSVQLWGVVMFFACLAACLTTQSTSLYGSGLSPDSVGYIRFAEDVLVNKFSFMIENKAVIQPPLYPIALAATSLLTGVTLVQAATWINILCSAAFIVVVLLSVSKVTKSLPVLIITGALSCLSIPLTRVWAMTWTEPLFILNVSLVLLIATDFKHPFCSAICAGLLTVAACFTRYAGIILIPVVAVFLFLSHSGSIWKRSKYAVIYAFLPTILFVLYVFRNYTVSGTLLGKRFPSQLTFWDNVALVKNVTLAWFFPFWGRSSNILLLIMCVLIGAVAWHNKHCLVRLIQNLEKIVILCAAFSVIYTVFIVWTSTTTAYDHIDNRLLSPIYSSVLVLFAVFLRPDFWRNQFVRAFVLSVFCFLFVKHPFRSAYTKVNQNANRGAGCFNSRFWQEAESINFLRQHGLSKDGRIFSNYPVALESLVGIISLSSPAHGIYNSTAKTGVTKDNMFIRYPEFDGALLIWFHILRRENLFSLEEVKNICDLEEIKVFSDGAIYRVRNPNRARDN